ncbi:MAG: phosphotransferase family protein [Bacillota bacterium]|jgi:aminoglycoside phosphotransferase (APT) family kinase protein
MEIRETDAMWQLAQRIRPGSKPLALRSLEGGISAQVSMLTLLLADGSEERLVVRQHSQQNLRRNPHLPSDQFRLLQKLWTEGLAVPRPVFLDQSVSPNLLVMEYVPGKTEFNPADEPAYLQQLATQLAQIHGSSIDNLNCLSRVTAQSIFDRARGWLGSSPLELQVIHALKRSLPEGSANPSVLLHGDYWPGNVLWCKGRIVAIVDWDAAAIGDPLSDLANARLEMLWALGPRAMLQFTEYYSRAMNVDCFRLPLWDLLAVINVAPFIRAWGLDPVKEQQMYHQLDWFAQLALARLP